MHKWWQYYCLKSALVQRKPYKWTFTQPTCEAMQYFLHQVCANHHNICVYIYIYTNFIKHNRHFMSTYFLLDQFEFLYYFYHIWGGIDLCIVHSCMYPLYFLPDFGPPSGEDLLQKWCNFCFSILLLCKSVFTVEDYGVWFWRNHYITKGAFTTVVEGYLKTSFSIAITLRCRGGHYSFPWIAPL